MEFLVSLFTSPEWAIFWRFTTLIVFAFASFAFIRGLGLEDEFYNRQKRLFEYISYLVRVNDQLREKNNTLMKENKELMEEVEKLEDELERVLKTKRQKP